MGVFNLVRRGCWRETRGGKRMNNLRERTGEDCTKLLKSVVCRVSLMMNNGGPHSRSGDESIPIVS